VAGLVVCQHSMWSCCTLCRGICMGERMLLKMKHQRGFRFRPGAACVAVLSGCMPGAWAHTVLLNPRHKLADAVNAVCLTWAQYVVWLGTAGASRSHRHMRSR
jgi:hypothetical protein